MKQPEKTTKIAHDDFLDTMPISIYSPSRPLPEYGQGDGMTIRMAACRRKGAGISDAIKSLKDLLARRCLYGQIKGEFVISFGGWMRLLFACTDLNSMTCQLHRNGWFVSNLGFEEGWHYGYAFAMAEKDIRLALTGLTIYRTKGNIPGFIQCRLQQMKDFPDENPLAYHHTIRKEGIHIAYTKDCETLDAYKRDAALSSIADLEWGRNTNYFSSLYSFVLRESELFMGVMGDNPILMPLPSVGPIHFERMYKSLSENISALNDIENGYTIIDTATWERDRHIFGSWTDAPLHHGRVRGRTILIIGAVLDSGKCLRQLICNLRRERAADIYGVFYASKSDKWKHHLLSLSSFSYLKGA